ncbi:MAG: SpoIIE family protein phosphatase [Gammaproteobacteria bacterium]|nr:SpoIIE family protein phosphatase [Gammaproteobacteria bacterium]
MRAETPRLEHKLIYWSLQAFIVLFVTVAVVITYMEILDFNADTKFYSSLITEETDADFLKNINAFETRVEGRLAALRASAAGNAAAGTTGGFSAGAPDAPGAAELLALTRLPGKEVRVTRYEDAARVFAPAAQDAAPAAAGPLAEMLTRRFAGDSLKTGWGKPLLLHGNTWRLPYSVQLDGHRLLVALAPVDFFFTGVDLCYGPDDADRFLAADAAADAGALPGPRLAAVHTIYTDAAGATGAASRHCLDIVDKEVMEAMQAIMWYDLFSFPGFIKIYRPTAVPGLVLGSEYDTADLYRELQGYLLRVLLLLLCVFSLVILAIRHTARKIVRALTELLTSAKTISEGRLEARLPERQDFQELAQFSRLVNNLVERLQVQIDRLKQETMKSAALDNEIAIAGHIQQETMTNYDMGDIGARYACDVGAFLAPAKQVAGDFFCLAPRPDGKLLFAIGDVSGKGVAAAMVARDCVNLLTANGKHLALADLLQVTNAALYERFARQSMFATLYCCLLDPKRRLLEHADAGHEIPLLYRRNDAGIGRLPVARNMALGFLPDTGYETSTLRLQADQCLLLYSDGLDGGLEQIRQARKLPLGVALLTNDALKNVEMQTLLQCVYKQALELQGNQAYDDITMVGVAMEKSGYKSFHLPAAPETAGAALARLRALCRADGVPAECGNRLCIILDEWVSNLVNHAEVDSDIIVSCLCSETGTIMEIVARCNRVLNPLEQPELDVDEHLQSGTVGGFGLHVIRNLANELAFDVNDRWVRLEARVRP